MCQLPIISILTISFQTISIIGFHIRGALRLRTINMLHKNFFFIKFDKFSPLYRAIVSLYTEHTIVQGPLSYCKLNIQSFRGHCLIVNLHTIVQGPLSHCKLNIQLFRGSL